MQKGQNFGAGKILPALKHYSGEALRCRVRVVFRKLQRQSGRTLLINKDFLAGKNLLE